ncbi:MAG: 2OG-Fe(II) oxygenase, partial [Novosphingobium sp.]
RPHHDAIAGLTNPRVWTVLIYLNEGYGGGETHFPANGLRVKGRIGDAVLFRNLTPAGDPDPLAGHAGLPVSAGEKWLATRWIRARPFDPWSGQR